MERVLRGIVLSLLFLVISLNILCDRLVASTNFLFDLLWLPHVTKGFESSTLWVNSASITQPVTLT